jgi:hypothetical protein
VKNNPSLQVTIMEEMHRIHKDVPYGYWVLWIEPAWRALTRKRRELRSTAKTDTTLDRLIALR